MKTTAWLVVSRSGIERLTKRVPSLCRSEVAIRLTVNIPDGVFRPLTISAEVDVPEDRVVLPMADVSVDEVPEEVDQQEVA